MKLGDRLERLAYRIASGEFGRGPSAAAKLLSLVAVKEILAIIIGSAGFVALFAIVFLLSYGLDLFGHAVSHKPTAPASLAREAPK